MFDALFESPSQFARRRPWVTCVAISMALPAVCLVSIPVMIAVVRANQWGYTGALPYADFLLKCSPVQLGPAAVSFFLGLYVLPTPVQRAMNFAVCFWSLAVIPACSLATGFVFMP